MNQQRRKRIAALIERLDAFETDLQFIQEQIEELRDEEQDARDNLPESLQDGDRGEAMQTAIDALDDAASTVDGATGELDSAKTALEAANA